MAKERESSNGYQIVELLMVVAIMAIIVGVAVPYYMASKRTACDRAASADLSRLAASLERFGSELTDLSCSNFHVVVRSAKIEWFVGPYYGWGGTNRRCVVRMSKVMTGEVQACSERGRHVSGDDPTHRYIYRVGVTGGTDRQPLVGPCAGSFYGGRPQTCYTTSMIRSGCQIEEPTGGVLCGQITGGM